MSTDKAPAETIDAYIADFPKEARALLEKVRRAGRVRHLPRRKIQQQATRREDKGIEKRSCRNDRSRRSLVGHLFVAADRLWATAAPIRRFNASASTLSPSWKSMARVVLASRPALNRCCSSREAPLKKFSFT